MESFFFFCLILLIKADLTFIIEFLLDNARKNDGIQFDSIMSHLVNDVLH